MGHTIDDNVINLLYSKMFIWKSLITI
jgi:hypothetical protein